jgi:hypothetical protein
MKWSKTQALSKPSDSASFQIESTSSQVASWFGVWMPNRRWTGFGSSAAAEPRATRRSSAAAVRMPVL